MSRKFVKPLPLQSLPYASVQPWFGEVVANAGLIGFILIGIFYFLPGLHLLFLARLCASGCRSAHA